jgi:hypothetical protein
MELTDRTSCSSHENDEDNLLSDRTQSSPHLIFPIEVYRSLYENLHENIQWSVNYGQLARCVEAAEEILSDSSQNGYVSALAARGYN